MARAFGRAVTGSSSFILGLFALVAAIVWSASAADAQQPASWRITSVTGIVRVALPGQAPAPARVGAVVTDGSVVTTGPDGSATVIGPHGRLDITPNSRVTLRRDARGFSRVLQDAGAILYSIDKRASQHFQVDAPLMTAVVKGTKFRIDVTRISTSIAVTEGLVEVRARQGTARRDVATGMFAVIMRAAPTILDASFTVQQPDRIVPARPKADLRGAEAIPDAIAPPPAVGSNPLSAARNAPHPAPDAATGPTKAFTIDEGTEPALPLPLPSRKAADDDRTGETGGAGWTVRSEFKVDLLIVTVVIGLIFAALLGIAPMVVAQYRGQSRYDPSFDIIEREDAFEIRRYEPAVIAEAQAAGDRARAFQSGLAALTAYAAGENAASARMAKAPPFTQTRVGAQWSLDFVIARHIGVNEAPAPGSARVRVRLQQSRLMAAAPVKGSDDRALERTVDELRSWATRNGYEVLGAPAYAYHGPFWAPSFLRHTEALVNVRAKSETAGKAPAL